MNSFSDGIKTRSWIFDWEVSISALCAVSNVTDLRHKVAKVFEADHNITASLLVFLE